MSLRYQNLDLLCKCTMYTKNEKQCINLGKSSGNILNTRVALLAMLKKQVNLIIKKGGKVEFYKLLTFKETRS